MDKVEVIEEKTTYHITTEITLELAGHSAIFEINAVYEENFSYEWGEDSNLEYEISPCVDEWLEELEERNIDISDFEYEDTIRDHIMEVFQEARSNDEIIAAERR